MKSCILVTLRASLEYFILRHYMRTSGARPCVYFDVQDTWTKLRILEHTCSTACPTFIGPC